VRIALIAHSNAPWTGHYARHLESRGHSVRVVSFSPDALDGFDVVYVAAPAALPRSLRYLAVVPATRRILRRFSPDVVLATYLSSNGMVAALATPRDTPLVVSARGGDVLRQAGYLPAGRLHGHLIRAVCRRASAVHAVSDELVEALVALGIPAGQIECFPVGIDLTRIPVRLRAHGANDPPRIICTRRQEEVYRNDTLVAALGVLSSRGVGFHATFVGGGPLLQQRRAQVRGLGLERQVRFVGQVDLYGVADLLRESDVYVSASTSDGTSSSLLEAMAAGAFPVVTAIRANEGWVDDRVTGLLFDVGDAHGLAHALERALGDAALREAAAAANRDRVERDGNQALTMPRLEALLRRAASR
jgi:glycosyltransferase involved in cell wall biosynthesis